MNKLRGRPRGNPPTRALIADAARDLFVERGYRGTTIRAVATAAGVDSALISYHFGSKQGLFGTAMDLRCGRSAALLAAIDGDRPGLADRLLRAVTALWEDAEPPAVHDEDVMRVFREFLEREVLGRIAEFLGGPDATERATAAVTVLGGLVFTRYLSPIGPAAAMTDADVRRVHGPSLRAALFRTSGAQKSGTRQRV